MSGAAVRVATTGRGVMPAVHRIGVTVVGLAVRPVARDQAGQQGQAAAHQNVGSFPANVPHFPAKAAVSFAGLRGVIFKAAKVAAEAIGASVLADVANRLIAAPTIVPGSPRRFIRRTQASARWCRLFASHAGRSSSLKLRAR